MNCSAAPVGRQRAVCTTNHVGAVQLQVRQCGGACGATTRVEGDTSGTGRHDVPREDEAAGLGVGYTTRNSTSKLPQHYFLEFTPAFDNPGQPQESRGEGSRPRRPFARGAWPWLRSHEEEASVSVLWRPGRARAAPTQRSKVRPGHPGMRSSYFISGENNTETAAIAVAASGRREVAAAARRFDRGLRQQRTAEAPGVRLV